MWNRRIVALLWRLKCARRTIAHGGFGLSTTRYEELTGSSQTVPSQTVYEMQVCGAGAPMPTADTVDDDSLTRAFTCYIECARYELEWRARKHVAK